MGCRWRLRNWCDCCETGPTFVSTTVSGPGASRVLVQAVVKNPDVPRESLSGFVESNGYVSIEADHFARAVERKPLFWQLLPGIGRTGSMLGSGIGGLLLSSGLSYGNLFAVICAPVLVASLCMSGMGKARSAPVKHLKLHTAP